jgi:hypothetical protein
MGERDLAPAICRVKIQNKDNLEGCTWTTDQSQHGEISTYNEESEVKKTRAEDTFELRLGVDGCSSLATACFSSFLKPCTSSPRFFLLNFITTALRIAEILGCHLGVLPLMLSTMCAGCIMHDAWIAAHGTP